MTKEHQMPDEIWARPDTHEGVWCNQAGGYANEVRYIRADLPRTDAEPQPIVAGELVKVRDILKSTQFDPDKPTFSNQGQAMDGYSELALWRSFKYKLAEALSIIDRLTAKPPV